MSPRADAVRNRRKILAAAAQVFAAHGPEASTEQVAAQAGVAIGTVFRHFPTKADLLRALMKNLLADVTAELAAPDTDLFTFFARLVRESAAKRSIIFATVDLDTQLRSLTDGIAALLRRAQDAGEVRSEIRVDEVLALLSSTCQGAMRGGWDEDLQDRTLAIVFAGLAEAPTLHLNGPK